MKNILEKFMEKEETKIIIPQMKVRSHIQSGDACGDCLEAKGCPWNGGCTGGYTSKTGETCCMCNQ
ncbi:MAG: hypothetical protein ACK2U1_07030 [Anaerolineales bacterium]